MEWPRGMNCIKTGGGRAYIVYITSRRRTVRLCSRRELYVRFLIRKLIRYSPPTQPEGKIRELFNKELCPGRFLLTWSMGYRQHCLNFSQKPATVEF